MQQSFTSTAACNIFTPQRIIKTHDLKPNQLNFINMSKKDTDNIPNRGRTNLDTSETNAYLDHSIAATFGSSEDHDVAVAPSLETTLDEDDAFTSPGVSCDIPLFPKRSKHFHSTNSIQQIPLPVIVLGDIILFITMLIWTFQLFPAPTIFLPGRALPVIV